MEETQEVEEQGHAENKGNGFIERMKDNPWIVSTFLLVVILIPLVIFHFTGVTGNVISEEDAGEAIINFFNSRGTIGAEILEINDEGSLYEVSVQVGSQKGSLYVLKDGSYIVQPLSKLTGQVTNTQNQEQPQDVPKSDKPKVELFVMSFCPYGNKAEDTMLPVYELLKDKVDWSIHYIVSISGDTIRSLHGQPETDQNIREVCVLNGYGLDKFWEFTSYVNQNCGSDGSCWQEAASRNGISTSKIQSCFDNEGIELMKAEAAASNQAGASGSPTLLINGVKSSAVYQYANSEAYKQAICSAFNDAPDECDEQLSGSTSTSTGGSC